MTQHDSSQPILVLVRRGRNGRGFSVSPVDDITNAAMCTDGNDVGAAILEMLDDQSQPRVDMDELMAASVPQNNSTRNKNTDEAPDDDDPEDDDGGGQGGRSAGLGDLISGGGDAADRVILAGMSALLDRGRRMSSQKVYSRGSRIKKRKR